LDGDPASINLASHTSDVASPFESIDRRSHSSRTEPACARKRARSHGSSSVEAAKALQIRLIQAKDIGCSRIKGSRGRLRLRDLDCNLFDQIV
jgi:hypothetical protein